jgi:hypothetical protein
MLAKCTPIQRENRGQTTLSTLFPQKGKERPPLYDLKLWSDCTEEEKQESEFRKFQTRLREEYPVSYDKVGFKEEEAFFARTRFALKKYGVNFSEYDQYLQFLKKSSPLFEKYYQTVVAFLNDMEFGLFEVYEKQFQFCFPFSKHPNPDRVKQNQQAPNDLTIRDSYTYQLALDQVVEWIATLSKPIREVIEYLSTVQYRDATCQYAYDMDKEKQKQDKEKIETDFTTCQNNANKQFETHQNKTELNQQKKKCQDDKVAAEKEWNEQKKKTCRAIPGCDVPATTTSFWNRITSLGSQSDHRAATSCVSIDRSPLQSFETFQKNRASSSSSS